MRQPQSENVNQLISQLTLTSTAPFPLNAECQRFETFGEASELLDEVKQNRSVARSTP